MVNWRMWLRWSWRDLRERWLQVVAIALIIALGTGVFAGLGGQETWRTDSLDLSYDRLQMHDIRISLADGSFVPREELLAALSNVPGIAALNTRLITPTLVNASNDGDTVLVSGQIVGVDVSGAGPQVDRVFVGSDNGRTLQPEDAGQLVAIVEQNFASHYALRPGDPLRVSGDIALDFVGTGTSPEYFLVVDENGLFFTEASLAVLFVPLETAQDLAGREGRVNDVALRLVDGTERETVRAALEAALAIRFPDIGVTYTYPEDNVGRKQLYLDAEGDQEVWNLIALLFLTGAALGAFNLAGRIVAAQRRQIGIGMALGVPRRWLAFRPLLIGLQVAMLGTLFGLAIGPVLNIAFVSVLKSVAPLPYYDISFYLPAYGVATVFGVTLPLLATLFPVWRAVRVQPVDAIRTGNLVAKGGGLNVDLSVLPLPGKSFTLLPFRNLLRAPWRSLLTVLGISMAVILLTAFAGFLDSFVSTIDHMEDALLYERDDRLIATLDFFYTPDSDIVTAISSISDASDQPLVVQTEAALILTGTLRGGGEEIDTSLELHDMSRAIWRPNLIEGAYSTNVPGIILSEKAAKDLGVSVGDTVTLEHPQRQGLLAFRLVESSLLVMGIHDNPVRALSYMDLSSAGLMGLDGVTNLLVLQPAAGVASDDIKFALLAQPGVASVMRIADITDAVDDALQIFVQILAVVQIVVLVMAFLIAFNSTSINVDERVREIATMFAFGLPVRTVTRMQMVENLIIGVVGTLLGVVLGWVTLNALLVARVEDQLSDFKFVVTLSPTTLAVSLILGIVVVTLTPLLSIRHMRRMDIPSTLRVME
ncbi:ABC transporter permease [Aggregatilinea lenta]|uniref:ABC transporter permease n=1 Tax=Aggregatilinea lenta TaxID=913108 RepID=UPI0013C31D11|nr:FtsX-like permease family protein [Aggregatilinea lenta]